MGPLLHHGNSLVSGLFGDQLAIPAPSSLSGIRVTATRGASSDVSSGGVLLALHPRLIRRGGLTLAHAGSDHERPIPGVVAVGRGLHAEPG
jgi:hypothetical protein